jgi:threonine/homoserine/homoserine lactone efflux protein
MGVGFVTCVPLGAVGLYTIRKTLLEGRTAGLVSALGASTVDSLYCAIAGLGLTVLSDLLRASQNILRIGGGLIMIALGLIYLFTEPPQKGVTPRGSGLLGSFVTTALLMLTNPLLIIVFTAVFSALGVHIGGHYLQTLSLILGVFIGSSLWAPILVLGTHLFKQGPNLPLKLINRISGALMAAFGLLVVLLTLL